MISKLEDFLNKAKLSHELKKIDIFELINIKSILIHETAPKGKLRATNWKKI